MWLLSDTLLDRVAGFITRTRMVNEGDRLGVAVSGGADSVVLLHLLNQLSGHLHFEPVVVHINHRLRGEASDCDEQFVRTLADGLALPVFVESAAPPAGDNLEQAARDQRRALFARLLDQGIVTRVALGHTMSDQAETVLFRMIRGTGLTGLAGMPPVSSNGLIRPLLEITRDEVRNYAAHQGLTWREDISNEQREFRRNFIRLELLPQLRATFHDRVEHGLANLASLSQVEEEYWGAEAARLLSSLASSRLGLAGDQELLLDSPALMSLPLAARRRVIREAIRRVKGDLKKVDSIHIDAILRLCEVSEGHDRVQVPGIDALRSFDRLRLTLLGTVAVQRHYQVDVACNQHVSLPFQAGEIQLSGADSAPVIRAKFKEERALQFADFDARKLEQAGVSGLKIRNWEPGDEYQCVGHSHPEKVKTLFQENRIYLWERRHWPVLEAEGQILWVRGFGPSADVAASDGSLEIVRLSYYKEPLRGVSAEFGFPRAE
ncbi:MAG: tRNA lysidine(34) synthetase TilS [Bryobacteraceae bacterium]